MSCAMVQLLSLINISVRECSVCAESLSILDSYQCYENSVNSFEALSPVLSTGILYFMYNASRRRSILGLYDLQE